MFNNKDEAKAFGNDLIKRCKEQIDAVSSLALKDQAINNTIALFETLVKGENQTIKKCYEILGARSRAKPSAEQANRDTKNLLDEAKSKLDLWHCFIEEIPLLKKPATPRQNQKITAIVLALFCNLINEIGTDKKGGTESAKTYCKRICERYKFPYTDRVRQNFYGNKPVKYREQLMEKVLPLIDAETKSKIENYLDSKSPPKQNLYA